MDTLEQFYVEFLKKGVDKGTALQKWCDATGTNLDLVLDLTFIEEKCSHCYRQ